MTVIIELVPGIVAIILSIIGVALAGLIYVGKRAEKRVGRGAQEVHATLFGHSIIGEADMIQESEELI